MSSRQVLHTLQALSRLQSPGPAPAFTHVHVARAILTIGDEEQIGRMELSRKLGIGEGAIRTIIKHLTQANIITIAKGGCVLTRRGAILYNSLRSKVSKVFLLNARQLALDKACAAVLIRASGRLVKRGIEQRDAAIRAGATGGCTLVFQSHGFLMPLGEGEERRLGQNDSLYQDLKRTFDPKENDTVLIISASKKSLAEHGAMAVALTFME